MPSPGAKLELYSHWLGLNIRAERVDLDDKQLARSMNADLHKFVGTISLRNGRAAQFGSALSDTVIRKVFRVGTIRYQIAGTNVYRAQSSVDDYTATALSSTLRTTIVPFKPLNDTTTWAFIADLAVMQKDDGTVTRKWGLAAPSTHAGRDDSSNSYTYRLAVTHIRYDGTSVAHEGNLTQVTVTE